MNADRKKKLAKEYDFRTLENLDEFTTRYMWPRAQIINNESQFYVNPSKVSEDFNPFRLSDAGLSIIAQETPPSLADYAQNQPFVSGVLTTRDKGHSQLFGYWEMSARLPEADGAWPAFWLLPTFEHWPDGIAVLSEIDIMEAVSDVDIDNYHVTAHTNETGHLTKTSHTVETNLDQAVGATPDQNLTNSFNRYGLSWDKDWLIWYFNDVEVFKTETPADMWVEPRHFLINLAVGGWGGAITVDDYPASYDIEYIRIYEYEKPPEQLPVCVDIDGITITIDIKINKS